MAVPPRTDESCSVLLVGTTDWLDTVVETLQPTDFTLVTACTIEETHTALDESPIECVISAVRLTAGDYLDVLRVADCPSIVYTDSGSKAPGDAIRAGVSDYIDASSASDDRLLDSLDRAVEQHRREASRRTRAQQFDAIFHDPRTYSWVLGTDGTLNRVNQTALDLIDEDEDRVVGEAFWTLPWWTQTEEGRTQVRRAVATSADGDVVETEMTLITEDDESLRLDITIRPVQSENGIESLVVEGQDITERTRLEQERRESEALHRVTLNNMTDTVLITDDSGRFTYVCPNVHFIFGYTAAEIHELGTIDELLGDELFERDELADEGVLSNIECTTTDKAGREHTLLVNVRSVSIQDGTRLYSCRDITKRKRREEALTALHETARELLYAATKPEVCQRIVDDVADILALDASAVVLFDTDENVLRPAATSTAMDRLNGPIPSFRASDDSITGHCFVEGEAYFFDDIHESSLLANQATELRSGAFVPLGDHGVFIAGSSDTGRFDDILCELTELLAATAEATLDRVERETTLRTQERALQRRNRELTRLDRINETIREIDQALVRTETQEGIERAVCEKLTADDRFRFAWIGGIQPSTNELQPREWAGEELEYLDSITVTAETDTGEPSCTTAATGDVAVVSNVADGLRGEPWRKEALSRDFQSIISVPIAYDEFGYGVLTVYAETPTEFDELSRAVVAELGETIASAISAVERKTALLTTSSTRLEFDIEDPNFVLLRLANEAGCSLSYRGGVQQSSDGVHVFVSVDGAALDDVVTVAQRLVSIDGVRVITDDENEGLIRLHLSQPFIAVSLADHGAVLRRVTADGSTARLIIDVPSSVDPRSVIHLVSNTLSNVELLSKQKRDQSSTRDLYSTFLDTVTDRQLEVIQTAFYGGFFETPRENTGEDIAEALGISPPAFYRHNRTVQRKLFSVLFDELGVSVTTSQGVQ
jgi:PAS domain S-box-containing protein